MSTVPYVLLYLWIWLTTIISVNYSPNRVSGEYDCDDYSGTYGPNDICTINCNSGTNNLYCGSAPKCIVNCLTDQCARQRVIKADTGTQIFELYVTGPNCIELSSVYLPNGGNATIEIIASTEDTARNSDIIAHTNTDHIWIKCIDNNGNDDAECQDVEINATTANYLEVTVINAQWTKVFANDIGITCPVNSPYNGPKPSSCIVNATNAVSMHGMIIKTARGSPEDVIFYGGGDVSGMTLTCTDPMGISNINIATKSFIGQIPCWNATANSTYVAPETDLTSCFGTGCGISSALNQGKIYSIQDWRYVQNSNYELRITDWYAESQTVFNSYGSIISGGTRCPSFNLSVDDFITGFTIYENPNNPFRVSGIIFNTRDGNSYSCVSNTGHPSTTISYDYNVYDFWYLTGWIISSGDWIDSMELQFTKSILTAQPTISPTPITVSPTTSTNQPTFGPTLNPSVLPTVSTNPPTYMTISPTSVTVSPTLNPSKYPSDSPVTLTPTSDDQTQTPTLEKEVNDDTTDTPTTENSIDGDLEENASAFNWIYIYIGGSVILCVIGCVIGYIIYKKRLFDTIHKQMHHSNATVSPVSPVSATNDFDESGYGDVLPFSTNTMNNREPTDTELIKGQIKNNVKTNEYEYEDDLQLDDMYINKNITKGDINNLNNNHEDMYINNNITKTTDGNEPILPSDNGDNTNYVTNISSEYEWIQNTLKLIEPNEWEMYLNNFKKNKINDKRIKYITDKDDLFANVIPELGVRLEFDVKWREYCNKK